MRAKFAYLLRLFTALLLVVIYSCQNDTTELPDQVSEEEEQVTEDLKSELTPLSTQDLPETVKEQLELTRKNLAEYLPGGLQISDVQVLGGVTTGKGVELSNRAVADKKGVIAYGNIMEPASVHVGPMQNLYSGKGLLDRQNKISEAASQEIKTGDKVMEITWKNGMETYKTQCFYRNTGIVWDNILTGLVMMYTEEQTQTSEENISQKDSNTEERVSVGHSYKKWWTSSWLWGSHRGEVGYKIIVYGSHGRVTNTDVEDWGRYSIGEAKSYSRVVKNSGPYGKIQYALGMCTPTGSLSFSSSVFKVSFSGFGSNGVYNGYKSLYHP